MARALARGWGDPVLCSDSGSGRAAALARELAANDWQVRDQITAEGGGGAGAAADRNTVLTIDWPRSG